MHGSAELKSCEVHRQEEDDILAQIESLMDDNVLGKVWFYRNVAIIDVQNIVKSAEEVEKEDIELGYPSRKHQDVIEQIVLTMVHELRHLMLDTNIVLSEEEYPTNLGSESKVEQFARDIVHKCGCGIYGK